MKILHLVIHTERFKLYEKMYEILSPFYQGQKKYADTFFIEYKKDLSQEFLLVGDRLFIKGEESMVPGLLLKTIDALLFFHDKMEQYNFVVRSNVSTIIDFNQLSLFISRAKNLDYFAGKAMYLDYFVPEYGITNRKYFGTYFAQGTLIGLSKSLIDLILKNRHKFHYEIVDDVAIGIFLREFWDDYNMQYFSSDEYQELDGEAATLDVIRTRHKMNQPIVWRNKSKNRALDVKNMETIASFLLTTSSSKNSHG